MHLLDTHARAAVEEALDEANLWDLELGMKPTDHLDDDREERRRQHPIAVLAIAEDDTVRRPKEVDLPTNSSVHVAPHVQVVIVPHAADHVLFPDQTSRHVDVMPVHPLQSLAQDRLQIPRIGAMHRHPRRVHHTEPLLDVAQRAHAGHRVTLVGPYVLAIG
eukprot:898780-Prymnesium_polylepis.2